MRIKLGVVMDPIQTIHYKKDSTLAMLWEASRRGYEIYYLESQHLFINNSEVYGRTQRLKVYENETQWFELSSLETIPLNTLDLILLRKDPPFNMDYIYTTYILEQAEQLGVKVFNKPQSIRDFNEKVATTWFPTCTPPTLLTKDIELLRDFLNTHKNIVIKPLDGMGGANIFKLAEHDLNATVAFEMLSHEGTQFIMAQAFIPAITEGDKRIILIDGEPIPYALARIPKTGELRGNLARGAKGRAQPLSATDEKICATVGPLLREKGLVFVGLDVIGDFLTEINVTSPTGIREIEAAFAPNITKKLFDCLESKL